MRERTMRILDIAEIVVSSIVLIILFLAVIF